MVATVTLVRAKFVELAARGDYAHQYLNYQGDASVAARQLPKAPKPTSVSLSTRGAPAAFTPTQEVLLIDKTVGFNTSIPMPQQEQLLGGGRFADALAFEHFHHAMGELDDGAYASLLAACVANAGLNTAAHSGGNVVNPGLATMTKDIVAEGEDNLVGGGTVRQDFIHFMSPRAYGKARVLFGDSIRQTEVFSPMLGTGFGQITINGIPILEMQSLPNKITVAATASSITSNVLTCTVPEGHGLQVGMPITTSGGSANVTTAAAITAATATTVQVTLTSADDATNGSLTITCNAAVSMIVPRSKAYWGGDVGPRTKMVDDVEIPLGRALQVGALYGAYTLEGYARQLLWPN